MATQQQAPAVSGAANLLIPFTAAAHEQTQMMGRWTFTPGASAVSLPTLDIPAGGFIRSLFLDISWAGGVGGTIAPDAPWSLLDQIQIKDVNGAALLGPLSGYQAFIADTVGGYRPRSGGDQLGTGLYSSTVASGRARLRLPIEIDGSNGLGALPNQLSNATYQLAATAQPTSAFGTGVTTAPSVTVNITAEYWTQPPQTDDRGRALEQNPPAVGTTQNWTVNRRPITIGANQAQVLRVGNVIRNLVCICRDASGVRTDAVMPDPITLYMDGVQLRVEPQNYNAVAFTERTLPGFVRPTGVFVYDFSHFGASGLIGNDALGTGWLPTTQGTRLEIQGNSAAAGYIDLLVNDILPAEIRATERYDERNQGTFKSAI